MVKIRFANFPSGDESIKSKQVLSKHHHFDERKLREALQDDLKTGLSSTNQKLDFRLKILSLCAVINRKNLGRMSPSSAQPVFTINVYPARQTFFSPI